jgi:hypothetical protein
MNFTDILKIALPAAALVAAPFLLPAAAGALGAGAAAAGAAGAGAGVAGAEAAGTGIAGLLGTTGAAAADAAATGAGMLGADAAAVGSGAAAGAGSGLAGMLAAHPIMTGIGAAALTSGLANAAMPASTGGGGKSKIDTRKGIMDREQIARPEQDYYHAGELPEFSYFTDPKFHYATGGTVMDAGGLRGMLGGAGSWGGGGGGGGWADRLSGFSNMFGGAGGGGLAGLFQQLQGGNFNPQGFAQSMMQRFAPQAGQMHTMQTPPQPMPPQAAPPQLSTPGTSAVAPQGFAKPAAGMGKQGPAMQRQGFAAPAPGTAQPGVMYAGGGLVDSLRGAAGLVSPLAAVGEGGIGGALKSFSPLYALLNPGEAGTLFNPNDPEKKKKFAEGGLVGMAQGAGDDEAGGGNEPDKVLVAAAITAILRPSDESPKILDAFVARFGEQALADLQERVAQTKDGQHVQGPGTGTSDSIPTMIDGQTPAALSNGEFVIPKKTVDAIGGGDNGQGAAHLHNLIKSTDEGGLAGMAR